MKSPRTWSLKTFFRLPLPSPFHTHHLSVHTSTPPPSYTLCVVSAGWAMIMPTWGPPEVWMVLIDMEILLIIPWHSSLQSKRSCSWLLWLEPREKMHYSNTTYGRLNLPLNPERRCTILTPHRGVWTHLCKVDTRMLWMDTELTTWEQWHYYINYYIIIIINRNVKQLL